MKNYLIKVLVLWLLILVAFFLGSGANLNISEWDPAARVMLVVVLLMASVIVSAANYLGSED